MVRIEGSRFQTFRRLATAATLAGALHGCGEGVVRTQCSPVPGFENIRLGLSGNISASLQAGRGVFRTPTFGVPVPGNLPPGSRLFVDVTLPPLAPQGYARQFLGGYIYKNHGTERNGLLAVIGQIKDAVDGSLPVFSANTSAGMKYVVWAHRIVGTAIESRSIPAYCEVDSDGYPLVDGQRATDFNACYTGSGLLSGLVDTETLTGGSRAGEPPLDPTSLRLTPVMGYYPLTQQGTSYADSEGRPVSDPYRDRSLESSSFVWDTEIDQGRPHGVDMTNALIAQGINPATMRVGFSFRTFLSDGRPGSRIPAVELPSVDVNPGNPVDSIGIPQTFTGNSAYPMISLRMETTDVLDPQYVYTTDVRADRRVVTSENPECAGGGSEDAGTSVDARWVTSIVDSSVRADASTTPDASIDDVGGNE